EAQRLGASFLDAEHRLRRVVEREARRGEKREAELRMQEAAAAHEAFARIFAIDHAVDAREIFGAVTRAGPGGPERASIGLRVLHTLGGRRMGCKKLGRARIAVAAALELGEALHVVEEAHRAVGVIARASG